MLMRKCFGGFSLVVLFLVLAAPDQTALGQGPTTSGAATDRSSFEVQMHLLVASNEASERAVMLPSLEPVVKQLKTSFPFTHYRVGATFTNRVKAGGPLEGRGVVSSDTFPTASPVPNSSTLYEFTMVSVKLVPDGDNQTIDIPKFRFGLRFPYLAGMTKPEAGVPPAPIVNYESAGITTELNLREGIPTVIGTMTTSRPNQILVLVLSVKRTP